MIPHCRFLDGYPAIGLYSLPKGCACFPNDREQHLCAQHVSDSEDLGGIILIKAYDDVMVKLVGRGLPK